MTAPTRAGLHIVHIKRGSLLQKLPGDGIGAAYARKHRQDRDSMPNSETTVLAAAVDRSESVLYLVDAESAGKRR